jgi:hypothetical protein
MPHIYILQLLQKSLESTLTAEEKTLINEWLNQSKVNRQLYRSMHDRYNDQVGEQLDKIDSEKGWQLLQEKLNTREDAAIPLFIRRYALQIAASIVLLVGLGFITYKYTSVHDPVPAVFTEVPPVQFVKPGSNKATLTLSNGSQIFREYREAGKHSNNRYRYWRTGL